MSQMLVSARFVWAVLGLIGATPALAAIQLNDDPVSGGGIVLYELTPDGNRVVYDGELNTPGDRELFSASISAPNTQFQINTTSVAGTDILSFEFAPDGTVVFRGDLEIDNAFELYSASSSMPNTQVKLNDDAPGINQGVSQFLVTPPGNVVIYSADLLVDNELEVYSAIVGSPNTQVRLTNKPVEDGDAGQVADDLASTPDAARAIYLGDLDANQVFELYSAPTDMPGMQIKLSSSAVDRNFNLPFVGDFLVTSDGSRVIYRGDLDGELYSAPTDSAGMEVRLNDSPVMGNVDFMRLAPDDSHVTYTGRLLNADARELFSADPKRSGSQVKLNNTPVASATEQGGVAGHFITPDSQRVVFTGDLDVLDQTDLYSAPIGMAGEQIQLNTNVVGADGGVGSFQLNSDGSLVVFSGDLNTNNDFELYSASTTAEGTQLTISTNNVGAGGGVGNFVLTPDTRRAVILGVLTTPNVFDLYSTELTAEGTQVALTNLAEGQNIFDFEVTPDGQTVVYELDSDGDFAADQLFAVDILGQNPPALLSDPLIAGGRIRDFLITPHSQTVIYRAEQDVVGEEELYAASLLGPPMGIAGDYNSDGAVNAADYTLWRDNLGQTLTLPGENPDAAAPGVVDQEDYDFWKSRFGQDAGGAAGQGPALAPEPDGAVMLVISILLLGSACRDAGALARR